MTIVDKVIREYYESHWTDDYPEFELKIILSDGKEIELSSKVQHQFMIPWNISIAGKTYKTYNAHISDAIANILPKGFINRDRLSGENLKYNMVWQIVCGYYLYVSEDTIHQVEHKYFKRPKLHIFNALYMYHYERYQRTELLKLFDFTLEKTDFKSLVLSDFSSIKVITDMNLRSEVIISKLREYLKKCNITYYVPIAQALITIADDDPNIYFRFCPKCNKRLISKNALQCSDCGFKWHICPKCGKKWVRDTSNCSDCGYSIYA